RWHCADADHADLVPDADLYRGELDLHRTARAGIYGLLPADGDADDRRLRRAGPVPVLRVFRGRPDPDVPDHRHLGRGAAHLRQLQIFPLHAAWLGADADRHAVDGELRPYHLHPATDGDRFPARGADMAVARLLRQLRRQDADVAGPHLAARRSRPGTDRGLCDPCRRAAEDGRIRLHPLLAADVPGGIGPTALADHGP